MFDLLKNKIAYFYVASKFLVLNKLICLAVAEVNSSQRIYTSNVCCIKFNLYENKELFSNQCLMRSLLKKLFLPTLAG
ncbi:hypothetical protein A1OE_669 [Candidatus Endolissoclinum faulkneri L2]|uniref:Uncharacterized protein n=1 Tax=Candidatus Endolissoclinum faulkneri L2 TaxID=1193729 RepID=K7YMX2_9PROT|nr:hypothetical protein A1OE_669 [Candidatus Endolissoclinum faulkneri L2]